MLRSDSDFDTVGQTMMSRNRKGMLAAFIDFRKAYDWWIKASYGTAWKARAEFFESSIYTGGLSAR